MTDIVERLRKWSNVVPVPPVADTMQEAATEIASLREAIRRLADQDAMLRERGNHSGKPNSSPTLTDAERAAILTAADLLIGSMPGATLRKLLERFA